MSPVLEQKVISREEEGKERGCKAVGGQGRLKEVAVRVMKTGFVDGRIVTDF